MAKLSRKNAQELLENGYITQEQFEAMFKDGVVSAGNRSTRPQINVPAESKAEFTDKAYAALVKVAEKMGFDYNTPTPDGGVATLYIKGAGTPRAESAEAEGSTELEA